jgi:hypothetical protein
MKNTRRLDASVYRGELTRFPGPWSFLIGKPYVILVSDQELESLADPDRVLNLTLTHERQERSLRQVCESAKAAGQRTVILAFDLPEQVSVFVEGPTPDSRGALIPSQRRSGALVFKITPEHSGRSLYVVSEK